MANYDYDVLAQMLGPGQIPRDLDKSGAASAPRASAKPKPQATANDVKALKQKFDASQAADVDPFVQKLQANMIWQEPGSYAAPDARLGTLPLGALPAWMREMKDPSGANRHAAGFYANRLQGGDAARWQAIQDAYEQARINKVELTQEDALKAGIDPSLARSAPLPRRGP
jgi:hypothetical protein